MGNRFAIDGGELWTPAEISLEGWWDASDASTITLGVSGVSQWDDKSGNGYNVLQATASQQPFYNTQTINNLNVVDWGEPENTKNLGFFTGVRNINWQETFAVARFDSTAPFDDYHALFGCLSGNGLSHQGIGFMLFNNQDRLYTAPCWYDSININGEDHIVSQPVASKITSTFVTSFWSNDDITVDGCLIGGDRNITNRGWRGVIGEIVSVGYALDTLTRQKIEGYLAHKWGLEGNLPSDHPYKSKTPNMVN